MSWKEFPKLAPNTPNFYKTYILVVTYLQEKEVLLYACIGNLGQKFSLCHNMQTQDTLSSII